MVPWCKLVAINDTMHAYPTHNHFVYVDSDAIISTTDPLPAYYWNKTLNMFFNFPWLYVGACSGIQFWKRSASSELMLSAWWNTASDEYNRKHDFEQSVLNTRFWDIFKHDIHIIREKTLVNVPGQRFKHVSSDRAKYRLSIFHNFAR